jgi:hypothetical protein
MGPAELTIPASRVSAHESGEIRWRAVYDTRACLQDAHPTRCPSRRVGRREDPRVARFYRLVCLVLDLSVLRGKRDRSKDVEILVLRHQLAVLHRQIGRPRFGPRNRAILTAMWRVVGRDGWSIFLVKPDALLRWHR